MISLPRKFPCLLPRTFIISKGYLCLIMKSSKDNITLFSVPFKNKKNNNLNQQNELIVAKTQDYLYNLYSSLPAILTKCIQKFIILTIV